MDDGLKQRLIGAVVLVAIAVIFLPSLFSGEHGRRFDARTQIPQEPETRDVVFKEPIRNEAMPEVVEPESMYQLLDDDGQASLPEDAVAEVKPKKASSSVDGLPAQPLVSPKLDSRGIPDAWVVQVASFNTDARASVLTNELQQKGYAAFTHSANIGSGRVYRVLVGPKIDKQAALVVQAEMNKLLKVSSILKKFEP